MSSIIFEILADFHAGTIFKLLGLKKFMPSTWLLKLFAPEVCSWFTFACKDFLFLLCGWNSQPMANLNSDYVPV